MSAKSNTSKVVRDGVSLAYHEAGAGDRSPILFVHGFGCSGNHLRLQQQHFAASTRTVAVDLRGHGASDAPLQEYDPIGFADDLRWLCDCLGLERPIVVGHSMGGNIALKLAVRAPEFVKAIVMIDTFVDGDSSFVQGLRELSDNLDNVYNFLRFWAQTANGHDGLSNYFRGFVVVNPQSATAHPAATDITVASTDTAWRNGTPVFAYAVSMRAYEPAWISVAQWLRSYVPVPPAVTMSPPTASWARSSSRIARSTPSARTSLSSTSTMCPS